jgi:hypothetical protein
VWRFNCSGLVTLVTNTQRQWSSALNSGTTGWMTDRDADGTMDCPATTRPEYDVWGDWATSPLPGASTGCSINDCRSWGGADSELGGGCYSCALASSIPGSAWTYPGEMWVR